MALPKIDTPVFDLTLPLCKKNIKFRPFLVKEQKNLLMAIEADDSDTIERNVRQVLTNCTITEGIDIDSLPVVDVEYYFLQLRARSVGEIVESDYVCNNVDSNNNVCGGNMKVKLNILEINVDVDPNLKDIIQLSDKISVKLKYPTFSIVNRLKNLKSDVEMVFEIVSDSIEYIFDGQQYYYANETPKQEMMEFLESLNQEQFSKLEDFFNRLPTMKENISMDCPKCGFKHLIPVEGLESFFE
jgi:hypothetical protein